MSFRIMSILCFCLILFTLGGCARQPKQDGQLSSQPTRRPGIIALLRQRIGDTWRSNEHDIYIPTYTWHNRLMYDSEKTRQYNENPWGFGIGKSRTDENGDFHKLVIMGFQDSHDRFQPYAGYGFRKNWYLDQTGDWSAGIGYVLGITARQDFWNYTPLPLPLPVGGIQYKRFAVEAAYIPGGYNNGNVLFIWMRVGVF